MSLIAHARGCGSWLDSDAPVNHMILPQSTFALLTCWYKLQIRLKLNWTRCTCKFNKYQISNIYLIYIHRDRLAGRWAGGRKSPGAAAVSANSCYPKPHIHVFMAITWRGGICVLCKVNRRFVCKCFTAAQQTLSTDDKNKHLGQTLVNGVLLEKVQISFAA